MKIPSTRTNIEFILLAFFFLVLVSVGATVGAIGSQQKDALIINLAGRQRMLSQRIVWLALSDPASAELTRSIQRFDQTLRALRDGGSALSPTDRPVVLPPAPDPALRDHLDEAARIWADLRVQIEAFQSLPPATRPPAHNVRAMQEQAARLLTQLDVVVGLFESRAQAKLMRLQWIQLTFLAAALGLLGWGYWAIRRRILRPLSTLTEAACNMGAGHIDEPIPPLSGDEFGELAGAFESMRTKIADARDRLETRVVQRTQELLSAFEFSQEIVAQLDLEHLLRSVTDRARTLTGARAASLCLLDENGRRLTQAAASNGGRIDLELHQPFERGLIDKVVRNGETITIGADCAACEFLLDHAPGQCAATPLRAGEITLGALCVVRGARDQFDPDETRALSLLANAAAIAIVNARMAAAGREQAEQAATLAERERMAAELHDNLAQTLGFLNLKREQIEEMLVDGQVHAARSELGRMKPAIEEAYAQVRAALTGLRKPPQNSEDLAQRLASCVVDLREASGITVALTIIDPQALALPRLTQIQVHHIVREALTNVRRHARARQAWVRVDRENGLARFTVEDDGCGFNPDAVAKENHLGLAIMRTRAQRQGGTLTIHSVVGCGTKIVVRFPLEHTEEMTEDTGGTNAEESKRTEESARFLLTT